jgi:5-methylcytosine-specific restriction endonuclease McrA
VIPKPKDAQTFPASDAEKARIRQRVYMRDKGKCVDCGFCVSLKRGEWLSMHLMHLKSKGSGGDWSMENLATGCINCHAKRHNAGGKPCPPKPGKEDVCLPN